MTDTGMKVWREAKRAHDGCKMQCMDMPDALAAAAITAAMAQDKARIAELERRIAILEFEANGPPAPENAKSVSIFEISDRAKEPRNVTDA